jgi:hypothetical protein
VGEDDALLEGGIGGERAGREVGRDPAPQLLVFVAELVDEVVLAPELLAEGVAQDVEGVRADFGEDLVESLGHHSFITSALFCSVPLEWYVLQHS